MAININNYNDVFGKLTKAVDIASASDNEEIKNIVERKPEYIVKDKRESLRHKGRW